MGRRRIYDRERYTLPGSVVDIVESICADYKRRERLTESDCDERVLCTCKKLNEVIDKSLLEIEEPIREDILMDIAEGRGYERSAAQYLISKRAYYQRRRKLIYNIAYALSLMRKD